MKNFREKLIAIIKTVSNEDDIELNIPEDAKYGDFTTNIAMRLAAQKKQSPMKIAQDFVDDLLANKFIKDNFFKIEAVNPGFINFYLNKKYLSNELEYILGNNNYGATNIGQGKTIVIEYSSPNTNKPLHLGHLRNDTLGMSLSNILSFLGFQVIRTSVINDRGIHIMQSLLAYLKWGKGKTPISEQQKGDHFVGDYYVKFNKAKEAAENLVDESREILKKWENGDQEIRTVWQQMNEWVYSGWQQTYNLFGSKFDKEYYESNLYDKGKKIIEDGVATGIFYQNKQGATVVDLTPYGLGGRESGEKVLLREDGTTVYITQDIYLAVKRYQDYKFDQLFYIVADEQNYHFKVLFKIFELLKYDWANRCYHYSYGMVDLPSGRMKSREGTIVDADDLLTQLINLARTEVIKRRSDLNKKEINHIATNIALAAVKYWFLKSNSKSRILFNPEKSLDFEGNTGPYLLYTYVRLQSILSKTNSIKKKVDGDLGEDELKLVRKMSEWPIVINSFIKHYNPNIICEYLYILASEINSYYHTANVLKADKKLKEVRLQTISAASQILKTGLKLLNIDTVDKM